MVTLSREAVARVARALITLNGSTTTLDVKNALRKLGYFAEQAEVRNLMLDVTSKDGDVQYSDDFVNGYRVYSFTTPFPAVDPQALPVASIATINRAIANGAQLHVGHTVTAQDHTTVTTTPTPVVAAPVAPTVHRDDVPTTYTVKSFAGFFPRTYTNVTRGEAKQRWAKELTLPYSWARTSKQA
jgi:hypothetical protein